MRALALGLLLLSSAAHASGLYQRSPWGLMPSGGGGGGTSAIDASGTASTDIDLSGFRIFDSDDECNLGTSAAATNATTAGADCIFGGRLEIDGMLFAEAGITLDSASLIIFGTRGRFLASADGVFEINNTAGTGSPSFRLGTGSSRAQLRSDGRVIHVERADGSFTRARLQAASISINDNEELVSGFALTLTYNGFIGLGSAGGLKFSTTSSGQSGTYNGGLVGNGGGVKVTDGTTGMGHLVGAMKAVTIAADDTTPDISNGMVFYTSANTGATVITDLDNPGVGQVIRICGGSATNSSTIADSGNFNLSAAWTASLDDCITLLVQADNDYLELARSDN